MVALVVLGVVVRRVRPELLARWAREEGVWEPLTVFGYLAGGLIVIGSARVCVIALRPPCRSADGDGADAPARA
jgi:hypothetical protein